MGTGSRWCRLHSQALGGGRLQGSGVGVGIQLGHPGVLADTQGRWHGRSWGLEGQREGDHAGIGTGEVLRGAVGARESLLGGAIASEALITGRTGGWCKYLRGPCYWEDWEGGHNYLRSPCYWEDWEGQLYQRS